jgi:geranylgeranyl diphosphate synthase type I
MMAGKTGALFGISALSGALIGTKNTDCLRKECAALTHFAEHCGIAFQLQDDILGITSTEEKLGKPIGSDIREGKATVLLLSSYANATSEEQRFLRETVGIAKDSQSVLRAKEILLQRGGVEYTEQLAAHYLEQARKDLESIPDSPYKDLLEAWRGFMLHRDL